MISPKNKTADELFQAELERRNISFTLTDEGHYSFAIGDTTLVANLENIRRNYERDLDVTIIENFVQQITEDFFQQTPDWETAKSLIRFSLEPSDYETGFDDVVHEVLSDELVKLFVLVSADGSRIAWITDWMVANWQVTRESVIQHAIENMNQLVANAEMEVMDIDGVPLGLIKTEEIAFKASFILTKAFRALVEPTHGWPVLVVAPTRDFVYVIPQQNHEFLGRVGAVVIQEYNQSGHPVTRDVLEVGDEGVVPIGTFSTEPK